MPQQRHINLRTHRASKPCISGTAFPSSIERPHTCGPLTQLLQRAVLLHAAVPMLCQDGLRELRSSLRDQTWILWPKEDSESQQWKLRRSWRFRRRRRTRDWHPTWRFHAKPPSVEQISEFLEAKYIEKQELVDLTLHLRLNRRITSHILALLVRRFGRMQLWQTAFALLFEFQRTLLEVDSGPYVAAADACRTTGRWDGALCVLSRARQDGLPLVNVSNAVGSAVFRCRADGWPRVLELLGDMLSRSEHGALVPDQISFAIAITACSRTFQWREALKVVQLMRCWRLFPESGPLSAAAAACNRAAAGAGAWSWSLQLCNWLARERLPPSLSLHNCAIAAASRGAKQSGNWALAVQQLDHLCQSRLQADRVSLSAVFTACQRSAALEPALRMLAKLPGQRLRACAISHASVVMACAARLKWQEGAALLPFLKKSFDTKPKFLRSMVKAAYWRESLHVLRQGSKLRRAELLPALEALSHSPASRESACEMLREARTRGWEVTVQEQAAQCSQCSSSTWEEALSMFAEFRRPGHALGDEKWDTSTLWPVLATGCWRVAWSLAFEGHDETPLGKVSATVLN